MYSIIDNALTSKICQVVWAGECLISNPLNEVMPKKPEDEIRIVPSQSFP